MTSILLYGFGLYDNHETNISGELVNEIRLPRGVHRKVFDVCFDRSMFTETVDACEPDIIIGLGQSARSRRIRIERKSVNLMGERGETPVPISPHGADKHFMSLDMLHDDRARISYDAGVYVCNFSMYVISEHCRGSGCRAGFIHLPASGDRASAGLFLENVIDKAMEGEE
jgi:pyrrolidone-carboxylate peptidase